MICGRRRKRSPLAPAWPFASQPGPGRGAGDAKAGRQKAETSARSATASTDWRKSRGAEPCGAERVPDRADQCVQVRRAQERNDVGRGPGSFGRPISKIWRRIIRGSRSQMGKSPQFDGGKKIAPRVTPLSDLTPPALRRAAGAITSPPTGSSSLPCQRRLHKLQGSTMPWRRFLPDLVGSCGEPEWYRRQRHLSAASEPLI